MTGIFRQKVLKMPANRRIAAVYPSGELKIAVIPANNHKGCAGQGSRPLVCQRYDGLGPCLRRDDEV